MSFRLILTLVLTVLVTVFVLQNTAVVEIRFLFWTVAMSRALLIVVMLVIGMALNWLLHGYIALRRNK
jgi:uncharacterized integral membrane protein